MPELLPGDSLRPVDELRRCITEAVSEARAAALELYQQGQLTNQEYEVIAGELSNARTHLGLALKKRQQPQQAAFPHMPPSGGGGGTGGSD